jgi:hypothetical protein
MKMKNLQQNTGVSKSYKIPSVPSLFRTTDTSSIVTQDQNVSKESPVVHR